MDYSIQLTCDTNSTGCFSIHPDMAKTLGILYPTKRLLRFGTRSIPINVELSNHLQKNETSLSSDLIEQLKIPLTCSFEIQLKENEIQLGPLIGLLAGYYDSSIKKYLDDLVDYLFHYNDIKGAIIVFSLEKVDKINKSIKGYLYNPVKKRWDVNTFPYPSSIFIMSSKVSSAWIKHFQSVIGDSVFNDFYLNKWSIHEKLAAAGEVNDYLPYSILYESPQDLYSFLSKYPKAIVKSISATNGASVYTISKEQSNIILTNPKKGETKVVSYHDKDQAYSLFKKYFREGKYMIQESIELLTTHNRTIDFRVILLKNPQGDWQVMGMFARQGKPGTNLSNIYPLIELGEVTLKEVWDLSELSTTLLIKQIYDIAIKAVKVIEQSGVHFANTGVDIKIDANRDIWIIGIQHCNPSHELALVAGFPDLYYEILKTNMLYAKKLAGFDPTFSSYN
jgi:hypothetical protein